MTPLIRQLALPLTLLLTITVSACGGSSSSNNAPPAGVLKLTIVEGLSNPLEGITDASVLLLDGTGDPVNNFTSGNNGAVALQSLDPGSYQLKISANGFSPSPAPGVQPLPVQIIDKQTTDITITLFPLANADTLGTITGNITDTSDNSVPGALILAQIGADTVTTISANDGSYILHNVPEGDATLTAFLGGLNFPTLSPVAVVANNITADQNIDADSVATGAISGNVNFVAGGSVVTVDVTLLHPESREVIPGMQVFIDVNNGNSYSMTDIPDGHFEIIASLENDGIVIDPDESVTQGVPTVDVNADTQTKDFKVTGAVELDTPATPINNIIPELNATPSFEWHQASSYSSVNDYVIEVVDESGATLWGGFDNAGQPIVTVPKGDPITIDYNFDGSASLATLEAGRFYQLRIFASSDDNSTLGFKLLSSTETLDGIFKVEE